MKDSAAAERRTRNDRQEDDLVHSFDVLFVLFVCDSSQRMVIDKVKAAHPEVPVIIYINKSGALLERMATSGVDVVSLDWTVTVPEARKRIGESTIVVCVG